LRPLLAVQHTPVENLGTLGDVLRSASIPYEYVRTQEGEPIPESAEGLGGLVVLGGPMSVYETEQYPHLKEEVQLIRDALGREVPVLGVCLGSQLLAQALGTEVGPAGAKELGWGEVKTTGEAFYDPLFGALGGSFAAFHWHGDAFELPEGAVLLASSGPTPVQAFRFGEKTYGLLFHLEVDERLVRNMLDAFEDEAREAGEDPYGILRQTPEHLPQLMARAGRFYEGFLRLLSS
jgi:GMP synthase (glutamine-hydrolysing)